MKAAHSLCIATDSTIGVNELTEAAVRNETSWSKVFLEKLTGPQLVKNFIT
jgi:hypothetical protein